MGMAMVVMIVVVMVMVMAFVIMIIDDETLVGTRVLKVVLAELRTENFGKCAIAGFDQ